MGQTVVHVGAALWLVATEEGRKLHAYQDSRGVWTIGYGYNLEAHGWPKDQCQGITWTQADAVKALCDELALVVGQVAKRWPKVLSLDEVRQAAVFSSVYQLGVLSASHFFATIDALQDHDWERAARQMLASRWAKQTPARVKRNSEMIRTGQWPVQVAGQAWSPDQSPWLDATVTLDAAGPDLAMVDEATIYSRADMAQAVEDAASHPRPMEDVANAFDSPAPQDHLGAPDEPIAPVLPAPVARPVNPGGQEVGPAPLPTPAPRALTVGGVQVSGPLVTVLLALALLALNHAADIGLDSATVTALASSVVAYILKGAVVEGVEAHNKVSK